MCAVKCGAIVFFLMLWWIVSLKVACITVVVITAGAFLGVKLKNYIEARRRLDALESVRFYNGKLIVGSYIIDEKRVGGAFYVYNKRNYFVALGFSLSNGLKILISSEYLHKTALKFGRLRAGKTADAFVFSDRYIEEATEIHKEFVCLQNRREVAVCLATDVLKAFVEKAMPSPGVCIAKNKEDARAIITVVRHWMSDYLEKSISTFVIGEDTGNRLQEEVNDVARNVVKLESCLFAQLNERDPVSLYQQYAFFEPHRLPENVGDRLLVLRGLGSLGMASRRRVIVCSDGPRKTDSLKNRFSGVFISSAPDIHAYNLSSETPEDERLEFLPAGHPTANCTYIQHPARRNSYIESSVYHLTILERKFVELQRVMRSVGAVKMSVDTGDTVEDASSSAGKQSYGCGAKYKIASGSFKYAASSDGSSYESVMYRIRMQGVWEPIQFRRLPDDLEFYNSEPQWKEIADAAIKGQAPDVKVRLEIKREAEHSQKMFAEAMAAAECLIVGFDVSVGQEFAQRSKELSSMYWDYHVVLGASMQQKLEDLSATAVASNGAELSALQRAELLILRSARQCLIENGSLTSECKAVIDAAASEGGLQRLRVLELLQLAREKKQSSSDSSMEKLLQ